MRHAIFLMFGGILSISATSCSLAWSLGGLINIKFWRLKWRTRKS